MFKIILLVMSISTAFGSELNLNQPTCLTTMESDTYVISCKNSNHVYESKDLHVLCDTQESCNHI